MSHPITAIYENGILRPLAPLNLPEQIKVEITIQVFDKSKQPSKPTMAELWSELDQINVFEPDIELPTRKDRSNPILDMPDEFFI
jgi:predicted DNA-binding antitoxin AbrB/MazE fold protein